MTTEAAVDHSSANRRVVATPRYHLLDGKRRIGPKIVPSDSATECAPVYGFSDKTAFDRFCHNSELALKPYPIVMTYLRNALGAAGDALALMVIDAPGPTEPGLQAGTARAGAAREVWVHEKRSRNQGRPVCSRTARVRPQLVTQSQGTTLFAGSDGGDPANNLQGTKVVHCGFGHEGGAGFLGLLVSDRVPDYLSLRTEVFGFELAALPESLQLPAADTRLTPRSQPERGQISRIDSYERNGSAVIEK